MFIHVAGLIKITEWINWLGVTMYVTLPANADTF